MSDWDSARQSSYQLIAGMVADSPVDDRGRPIVGRGGLSVRREGDVWVTQ